ncbi:MAG TPA: IS200/IS605 family transposase [Lentisphaeria bacterium]|nr:IS200/IS605 family transposase [Lentisphaeria bacterium]
MSYTRLFYHIIFRTKYSEPTINNAHADDLYRYIWGIVKNQKGILYRINGMPEHLHLFVQLPPSISVSDFVRNVKGSSSKWLMNNPLFPMFRGWASEYAAISYSERDREMIVNYIIRQREHHQAESFRNEIARIFNENGLADEHVTFFFKEPT